MKKNNKLTIVRLLMAWVILSAGLAEASQVLDPTDIGIGARPIGMGRAYTAVADDVSSLFTNPAGLAQKKSVKFLTMWGNMMAEVPYNVVGASVPMWGGTVGLGYAGLQVGGIRESVLVNGVPELTGSEGSFNNSSINLAYATDIVSIPMFSKLKAFSSSKAGISFKMVSQGFSGFSSFEPVENSGFDIDLGLISTINDDTKLGFSIKNLIPGNNIGKDELPTSVNVGISKYFSKFNLLTDLDIDMETTRNLLLRAGFEWGLSEQLKIRMGLDQKPSAGSTITNLAAGIGLSFKGISFDYAYHTFAGLPELSTHFFSICITGEEQKPAQVEVKNTPVLVQPKSAENKKNKVKTSAVKKNKVPVKKQTKGTKRSTR